MRWQSAPQHLRAPCDSTRTRRVRKGSLTSEPVPLPRMVVVVPKLAGLPLCHLQTLPGAIPQAGAVTLALLRAPNPGEGRQAQQEDHRQHPGEETTPRGR